ncbi:MAG: sugar ABC transporter ATP-binding protein [Rhizobiaceae bacterium]
MTLSPSTGVASATPVLEFTNLSKRFGGAKALDGVSFSVAPREVHGLLGQNGSGKSTLIKILAGFHAPDPGAELKLAGREVPLPLQPGDFHKLGIAFVHQHLGLVSSMSVVENFLVGDHATGPRWRIRWDREAKRARALFQRFDLAIDPYAPVSELSSVQRAQLAIMRAFDQLQRASESDVRLLILDEPTPFLPASDVQVLFRLVRSLVAEGASVVFVSHDIDEVMDITDRITVLRDGQVAGTLKTSDARKADIVRMIVGRAVDLESMRPPARAFGPEKARIDNLQGPGVADFSVALRAGEVVGLTGLIGSGYDDVVHLVYGSLPAKGGRLAVGTRSFDVARISPSAAVDAGIVLVPGDRLNDGAVATLTVAANATLPVLDRGRSGWLVSERGMNRVARRLADDYDVRPRDPTRLLGQLSGGNQQKVVLAKWFQIEPELILLDEPTQGVDIGAREQVFMTIRKMSERGAAVLCASSDHEQLAALCDRVIVFVRGRATASLEGDAISKRAITELCYTSSSERPGSPA